MTPRRSSVHAILYSTLPTQHHLARRAPCWVLGKRARTQNRRNDDERDPVCRAQMSSDGAAAPGFPPERCYQIPAAGGVAMATQGRVVKSRVAKGSHLLLEVYDFVRGLDIDGIHRGLEGGRQILLELGHRRDLRLVRRRHLDVHRDRHLAACCTSSEEDPWFKMRFTQVPRSSVWNNKKKVQQPAIVIVVELQESLGDQQEERVVECTSVCRRRSS